MQDLSRLTGMPRQAIHFYIQEGLLPEGHKTGRNMAYYGEAHLARIRLIRQLQEERFLPLKAIRAALNEQDEVFTPAQRPLLLEVKRRLAGALKDGESESAAAEPARALLSRLGVEKRDLDGLEKAGLLATRPGPRGERMVSRDDIWLLETLAALRAAGFTRELGFEAEHLAMYEEAVTQLFRREVEVLGPRARTMEPDAFAALVERSLPLIHALLVRQHEAKIRQFFAAI